MTFSLGRIIKVVSFVFILFIQINLYARSIHYGAINDLDLNRCDDMQWNGNYQSAQRCYLHLLQVSDDILLKAEATWAMGDIKTANSFFQSAVEHFPNDASVRLRWADLFMQTYQYQDALRLFEEALELQPENSFARVGLARVLVERFESDAKKHIEHVLNNKTALPGARYQAMLLMARIAMENSEMLKAVAILKEAQLIAVSEGLPQLESYALFASIDMLEGVIGSDWVNKALSENKRYGDIYAIPGYYFWVSRRYREAIELFSKAIEIEPNHWVAYLELGINLLRDNQVSLARHNLEIAYQGDPYNPKTVNTLRLLDTFGDYDLIDSPKQTPADKFPRIIFRLHKDESAVLGNYAESLAEKGIREFTKRYQFEPREPIVIEIYPNHDDFVVRTIGMPGVGILGATFGYVFAMDSPTDHPDNEYHWGTTLWHEMAHVFTLESTDHLVPRWFSEGVSVFEEWRNGPIKGIHIPVNVLDAMTQDKFLPIEKLDSGFIRPSYSGQVIVSYMQAGLICDYINRQYGNEKIVDLLSAFKEDMDTGQAIRLVFSISPSQFDAGFKNFINEEYGFLLSHLDDWKSLHQKALIKISTLDWQGAKEFSEKALDIFPEYVESNSPYILLARANAELGNEDAELNALMNYWQKGGYAPEVIWLLARKLYGQGEIDQALLVLQSLNLVDPFDTEIHNTLGDWLLESGKPDQALTEYMIMLEMDPHDMAAAYYKVAQANYVLKRYEAARTNVLSALEIAPHFRLAQKLLLETTQLQ